MTVSMEKIIQSAIETCWDYRSYATPNPSVAAYVIDDSGNIVGHGITEQYPGRHAEPVALLDAGNKSANGTLFVTLEPCCHHGKNPPCTDAIIAAGIRKVIYAIDDPFLKGMGAQTLREAGVTVLKLEDDKPFADIYRGFFTRIKQNRPHIIHKIAIGPHGMFHQNDKVGNRPVWITGEESRHHVHIWRGRSCAILTSLKSVQDDQSRLDVRMGSCENIRQPDIIALSRDPQKYLGELQRLAEIHRERTIYGLSADTLYRYEKNGLSPLYQSTKRGLDAIYDALSYLKLNNVYVEIGHEWTMRMIEAGFADEYHFHSATDKYYDDPVYHLAASRAINVTTAKCAADFFIMMKRENDL